MTAANIIGIYRDHGLRREAESVARIEESCGGFAEVIRQHRESTAYDAGVVLPENLRPESLATGSWRPGDAQAWQEDCLVPVVKRRTAIGRT